MGLTVKKTIHINNDVRLKEIIRILNSKKIRVGIFGGDDSEMLMIATVNEYGCDINITPKMRWWLRYNGLFVKDSTTSIHIPERSFVRKTANEKKDQMDTFIKQNLDLLFTFQIDVNMFLNKVGQYCAQLVQETLTETETPPNHPWTIQRKKGKEHPLIDTGHLRESITYRIE
jgi:hypothetical protein